MPLFSSSKRLTALIDDLLEFSRLSQVKHKFSKVDLQKLLDNVVDDFDMQIASKSAKVNYGNLPVSSGIEPVPD